MAFQVSDIRLIGKIGDLIGYEVGGKIRTRFKAKKYELTEESKKASKEFGFASAAGRLIRQGLAPMINKMSDKSFTNQLNKKLREVVATGPGEKGARRVAEGDLALLKKLQLSKYTRFDRLLSVAPLISVDEMGTLNITLPECKPALTMMHRPLKAKEAVIKINCMYP